MSSDRLPRPVGEVSARTVGAARILRRRAQSARAAALQVPDQNSPAAAAMRGKARGYDESADVIERLERGLSLNGKRDRMLKRADA